MDKLGYLFLVSLCIGCFAPKTVVEEVEADTSKYDYAVRGEIDYFDIDKLGNIYILKYNNEVIKLVAEDQQTGLTRYIYNNFSLGDIGSLDVSNPLKLLVYHNNFNQVVSMDNTLSVTGNFDLNALGFQQAPVVCGSNDNQFWIYDEIDARIKKIKNTGVVVEESQELYGVIGRGLEPIKILENGNFVYVQNEDGQVYLFDNFGKFVRPLELKTNDFQVDRNRVLYLEGNKLFLLRVDEALAEAVEIAELPEGSLQARKLGNEILVRIKSGIIKMPLH